MYYKNNVINTELILGCVPKWLSKFSYLTFFLIFFFIFIGCWLIEYPVTIRNKIIITKHNSYKSIISTHSSVLDTIFYSNGEYIEEGDVIGIKTTYLYYEKMMLLENSILQLLSNNGYKNNLVNKYLHYNKKSAFFTLNNNCHIISNCDAINKEIISSYNFLSIKKKTNSNQSLINILYYSLRELNEYQKYKFIYNSKLFNILNLIKFWKKESIIISPISGKLILNKQSAYFQKGDTIAIVRPIKFELSGILNLNNNKFKIKKNLFISVRIENYNKEKLYGVIDSIYNNSSLEYFAKVKFMKNNEIEDIPIFSNNQKYEGMADVLVTKKKLITKFLNFI